MNAVDVIPEIFEVWMEKFLIKHPRPDSRVYSNDGKLLGGCYAAPTKEEHSVLLQLENAMKTLAEKRKEPIIK